MIENNRLDLRFRCDEGEKNCVAKVKEQHLSRKCETAKTLLQNNTRVVLGEDLAGVECCIED